MAVLAVGTMVLEAMKAAEGLAKNGLEVTIVNCRFLKPLDDTVLTRILREHTQILTVEEGAVANGFGAFVAREIEGRTDGHGVALRSLGIPDRFVAHGGRAELLREIDLDAQGIAEHLLEMAKAQAGRGPSLEPRVMETA